MSGTNVKIVGHELVEEKEKMADGTVYAFDMLHVKMRGYGEDKKTRMTLVVDCARALEFPLGEKAEIAFEIRQQRLNLSTAVS